jgi:IS5 family transposase
MQSSLSDPEYAARKKQTRRDRFLAEIEAVTPNRIHVHILFPEHGVACRESLH